MSWLSLQLEAGIVDAGELLTRTPDSTTGMEFDFPAHITTANLYLDLASRPARCSDTNIHILKLSSVRDLTLFPHNVLC